MIHKLIHHPITYSCIFFNLQNTCYDKAWCCLTDGLVTVYLISSLVCLSWFRYIILFQNHRMKFLSLRLYFLKIWAPSPSPPRQDSKSWKFLVEAHQYTALSCFTAWFNLLADSSIFLSCTHELCKMWLLKIKRREKTTNLRPQNPLAKKIV